MSLVFFPSQIYPFLSTTYPFMSKKQPFLSTIILPSYKYPFLSTITILSLPKNILFCKLLIPVKEISFFCPLFFPIQEIYFSVNFRFLSKVQHLFCQLSFSDKEISISVFNLSRPRNILFCSVLSRQRNKTHIKYPFPSYEYPFLSTTLSRPRP